MTLASSLCCCCCTTLFSSTLSRVTAGCQSTSCFVFLINLFSVSLFADDTEPEKQLASWSSWRIPDHHENRLYCVITATAWFIKYRLSGSYQQYCFRSCLLVLLDQVRGEAWIRQPTVQDVHVVSNFIYIYIYSHRLSHRNKPLLEPLCIPDIVWNQTNKRKLIIFLCAILC